MIQDIAWSPRFVASTTATAATASDVNAGTDTNKFITPAALAGSTPTLTLADVVLGTSGPSAKSSIAARASRQGLVFDGTAGVTVASVPAYGTGDFTFSAWINPATLTGTQCLIGGGTSSFVVRMDSGVLAIAQQSVDGPFSVTSALTAGKLVHFVYTRSGTTGTGYLNGVAGTPITDAHNFSVANTLIGCSVNTSTAVWNGAIDGASIYNRALSAAEVVALYEAGVPADTDYNNASNTSLITGDNSTFASDTGYWNKAGGATIGSGTCVLASSSQYISKASLLTVGKRYRVQLTNTSGSGNVAVYLGGGTFISTAYAASVTFEGVVSTNGTLTIATTGNVTIDTLTLFPIGVLLAPDAGQAGNGYVWNDVSGNVAQIALPSSGVTWNVPSIAGNRIRGTTNTNGNQQLLGASVLLSAESQILHVRARSRSGTPSITIGTASGGAQIVASVALSTTWQNLTIALTGGIVSSADDIWIGSNSTDVVETDISWQPLDF